MTQLFLVSLHLAHVLPCIHVYIWKGHFSSWVDTSYVTTPWWVWLSSAPTCPLGEVHLCGYDLLYSLGWPWTSLRHKNFTSELFFIHLFSFVIPNPPPPHPVVQCYPNSGPVASHQVTYWMCSFTQNSSQFPRPLALPVCLRPVRGNVPPLTLKHSAYVNSPCLS